MQLLPRSDRLQLDVVETVASRGAVEELSAVCRIDVLYWLAHHSYNGPAVRILELGYT
jgi:hypothetical protein